MIRYVLSSNGETVASLEGCMFDAINAIEKQIGALYRLKDVHSAAVMPDKFTARANCHPDDTYDEDMGIKIARERVLKKYFKARIAATNRAKKVADGYAAKIDMCVKKSKKTYNENA